MKERKAVKGGNNMKIILDVGAYLPTYAHDADAGMDLRTPVAFIVPAHGSYTVDTGVHIQIPVGQVGFIKSKSGLNVKGGLTATGVVDSGFSGSIRVKLYNHSDDDYMFSRGDKITQLVLLYIAKPENGFEVVDHFEETERGDNGFGSTGR